MRRVAVIGGGPAGSFAAERLARAGLETVVFDEKLAWEKPCGGGLTYKAWNEYPFLIENDTPRKHITRMNFAAGRVGPVPLHLTEPLLVYSRFDLNNMLLRRAENAGAQLEKTRVLAMERRDNGWRIRTRGGESEADFCVVATGGRNPLRNVGTEWGTGDTATALGYFVPGDQADIDVQFLPGLDGYIWVFPRCGHLSVGICGKSHSAQLMRARLERYMEERSISTKGAQFYGHVLPSLSHHGWQKNRIAGDRWLAVGDAAGLVDPLTGEGLYYAMRSGDFASRAILDDAVAPEAKAQAYRKLVHNDFGADLEFAALLAGRLYYRRFMFGNVPVRMVQFTRRSPRFCALMQDLVAGTQSYVGLKSRLMRGIRGTFGEAVLAFFLNRLIPGEYQV
ncbi:MAG TPA: NAD(P)/FAD-dependent oxidoreductase [Bryobacteraceae bacterium]|nr:NAD(P)/FAD-dependent oxidoreductase [Bryobacteraceae bacterium]